MATLKQLREQIIIDAGILGNNNFPTPRLDRMINLAQRYVQIQLNGLGMKKWETSISPTLGSSTYAGSSVKTIDFSAITNISESPRAVLQIDCNDGTTYGIARETPIDDFEQIIGNTYTAPTLSQPRFMRLANKLFLSPATITAATVYYYKVVSDLTSDSDASEIPIEFERFIIKKVVLDILNILGNVKSNISELDQEIQLAYDKFLGREKEEVKADTL